MVKNFIFFIVGALCVCACSASPKFPFKFYGLDAESYAGFMRGPSAELDKMLEECRPTEFDKSPCMVIFTAEYIRVKADWLQKSIDLKACEER